MTDIHRMRSEVLASVAPLDLIDDLPTSSAVEDALEVYGIVYGLLTQEDYSLALRVQLAANEVKQASIRLNTRLGRQEGNDG